ncbi:hypothetical protein PG994_001050 [Apiospora phragmitis]|uniref:Uncharacterized protein n=1 Tax=Apiospora phragmitis TaxID=2905665 RepID=A0ABR1WSF2_9PEZI
MEPLSLLGVIASICSIFNSGSDLVKKFRQHRKERKEAKENKALKRSIRASRDRHRHRQAYDDTARLFSQSFRFEDDISKSQFEYTVIKMRRWIDLALVSSRDDKAIIFPQASLLRSMSAEIQSSIMNDLAGLSQRMMQAGAIRSIGFCPPSTGYPPPTIRNASSFSEYLMTWPVILDASQSGINFGQNPACAQFCTRPDLSMDFTTDSSCDLSRYAVALSHASGRTSKYTCRLQ